MVPGEPPNRRYGGLAAIEFQKLPSDRVGENATNGGGVGISDGV